MVWRVKLSLRIISTSELVSTVIDTTTRWYHNNGLRTIAMFINMQTVQSLRFHVMAYNETGDPFISWTYHIQNEVEILLTIILRRFTLFKASTLWVSGSSLEFNHETHSTCTHNERTRKQPTHLTFIWGLHRGISYSTRAGCLIIALRIIQKI